MISVALLILVGVLMPLPLQARDQPAGTRSRLRCRAQARQNRSPRPGASAGALPSVHEVLLQSSHSLLRQYLPAARAPRAVDLCPQLVQREHHRELRVVAAADRVAPLAL